MRLIDTMTSASGYKAKVYKDSEWNEYRVRFFSPTGAHREIEDHHTSDKGDALSTARYELSRREAA